MSTTVAAGHRRIATALDRYPRPKLFLVVVGPILVLYLLSASWWETESPDTFTNALTAHSIGTEGTVYLDHNEPLLEVPFHSTWIVEAGDRHASMYPPGAALHAAPAYRLWPGEPIRYVVEDPEWVPADRVEFEHPAVWPAVFTAALVTALAIGVLALTFRELTSGSIAVAAAYVAGLGTSAWSVAANALWQHGPGMLWLSLAGLALARARPGRAGLAYGMALVVRPLSGAIAFLPWVFSVTRRRWRAVVLLGAGVALGLGATLWFNASVHGAPSVWGGYGSGRADQLVDRGPSWFVLNFAKGLLHPRYGVLLWSPFLVPLLPGLREAWRRAEDWVRAPAAGAVLYLVLQWSLNRASGGINFFSYRYPLEPLIAAAPLMLVAYLHWIRPRRQLARVTHGCVVVAIAMHAYGAFS